MLAPQAKTLAKLALSVGVFAFAISLIDLSRFANVLKQIDPQWLAAGTAVWVAYQLTNAYVARLLLGETVTVVKVWRVNLISTYFGLFLPGDVVAGMASRLRYLGLPSWRDVVLVTVAERLVGLGASSVVVLVLYQASSFNGSLGLAGMLVPTLVLAASIAGLILIASDWARRHAGFLLNRINLESTVRVFPVSSAAAWLAGAAVCIEGGLVSYCMLRGLATDISFVDAVLFSYLATLVQLIPMFFAGIGIRDLGAIAILGVIGVSREVALASALIGLLLLVLSGLIGGLLQISEEKGHSA